VIDASGRRVGRSDDFAIVERQMRSTLPSATRMKIESLMVHGRIDDHGLHGDSIERQSSQLSTRLKAGSIILLYDD
jgi:hypothetical protein